MVEDLSCTEQASKCITFEITHVIVAIAIRV